MKHSRLNRVLAGALAFCVCVTMAVPGFAAKGGKSGQKNKAKHNTSTSVTTTLVEDETTVENGEMLRTSTYALNDGTSAQADSTPTLKYFPVTMYNYDKDTINNATHQQEVDDGLGNTWNGIYFNNGSPGAESYTYTVTTETTAWTPVALSDVNSNDTYVIVGYRGQALTGSKASITGKATGTQHGNIIDKDNNAMTNATKWTISQNGNNYQISATIDEQTCYVTFTYQNDQQATGTMTESPVNLQIVDSDKNDNSVYIGNQAGDCWLNQFGGTNSTTYKGYSQKDDGGLFYIYKLQEVSGRDVTTSSLPYAAWNKWKKNGSDDSYGQKIYSGLVESTLTANKDITFTKPDGGIFNSDATVKDIYTNVDMPFVYENGTYTFDASQNGVYFVENQEQGSTVAQSNGRLYFDKGNTQKWPSIKFGDGSTTVWAPFDGGTTLTGREYTGNIDYHFGMRTTIPFTMTANGKMNPNDDNSQDITFSFSGDDDVWVFIDGQLVLDLGGIHNRLNADINFAENTWTLSDSNNVSNQYSIDDAATPKKALSGTVFNDGDTTGTLNQTRETFAASDSHELTIFYLERGAGSSNCKIEFNLPMKDSVSVKKIADRSKTTDGEPSALTDKEKTMVANTDFGFTLYKDNAVVANTNYSLLNENGQVVSTPSTDANGHFILKAGQTAKFVGTISDNTYYVVEDANDSFQTPDYKYTAEAANGSSETETANGLTSMKVNAKGSDESEDSVVFTCENYLKADLPNPTSKPADDKIVIDYGLPVVIDVLKNDVHKGESYELTSVSEGKYGTANKNNDGTITYQLTKQLTGVEVLTYTATASNGELNDTGEGKVYIIPATSMYYEEDFSNLVTFSDGWSDVGTAQTDPQEPGVVGTVGDSPYGSDAAYLNDSGDSNGSSKQVSTTDGEATFSYEFTGTGTSFFARTGSDAAYMRVVVKNDDGESVSDIRRNNIYKAVDGTDMGTLYNVPVYTCDGLDYGTYTVAVTLMKAKAEINRGSTFYLDGIRVIQPLNSADTNVSVADAAYATDGEANMTVATLRQKLLGDASINEDGTLSWDGTNFVVFTDSNGSITAAEEYKSNGPKEEVYLNNGQSVTFSLENWDANSNKIYLGVKAPLGSGSVSINGNTLNLSNAADCYYDISGYAQITTDDAGVKTATFKVESTSSLVSVTNIKVTGNAEFTIIEGSDVEEDGDIE